MFGQDDDPKKAALDAIRKHLAGAKAKGLKPAAVEVSISKEDPEDADEDKSETPDGESEPVVDSDLLAKVLESLGRYIPSKKE